MIQPAASDTSNEPLTVTPNNDKPAENPVTKQEKDSAATQHTIDSIPKADPALTEKNETKQKSSDSKWKKELTLFAGLGGNSLHDSPKNSEYIAKIKEDMANIRRVTVR